MYKPGPHLQEIQGRKSGCADNLLFLACVQVMLKLLFWEPQSLKSWLCVPGKFLSSRAHVSLQLNFMGISSFGAQTLIFLNA